jgi:hypothetical protein
MENLKDYSDLQLIMNYQDSKGEKFFNELFRRFNKIIYFYAFNEHKCVNKSGMCTIEDIRQEYILQFLELLAKVNRNKVKDWNKFNFVGMIFNRFNAYSTVIRNKYFEKLDIIDDMSFEAMSDENYQNLYYYKISKMYNMPNLINNMKNESNKVYSKIEFDCDMDKFIEKQNPFERRILKYIRKQYTSDEISHKVKTPKGKVNKIRFHLRKKFEQHLSCA